MTVCLEWWEALMLFAFSWVGIFATVAMVVTMLARRSKRDRYK